MEQMNILTVSEVKTRGMVMKQMKAAQLIVAFGMGLTLVGCGEADGPSNSALAQSTGRDFVAPTLFQAAGPNIASIQNTVE